MHKIRKPLLPLLAVAPVLWLTACHHADPLTPDATRFAPVALPVAPQGAAQCDDDGDGQAQRCLSQAQADALFNATIDALCAANDKLAWLSDFYLATALPPSCGGN